MSQNSTDEVNILAQIQRNEMKLQQLAQLDQEDEYELQLKQQQLADLKEQNAIKSKELRKSLEIGKGLAQMKAAAQQNAESNLRLCTAHEALLLQNRAQHQQLLDHQNAQRAAILRQHHEAHDRLRSSFEARPDVAALCHLRQQVCQSDAAIATANDKLQQLQVATVQQRSQSQQTQCSQIVRLAALAVHCRDLDDKKVALLRMHRTQCDRIAVRDQLLQLQAKRSAELQQRLTELKHEQATTFFENIETISPLGLELDDSAGSPGWAAEAQTDGKSDQLQTTAPEGPAKPSVAPEASGKLEATAAAASKRASQSSAATIAIEMCAELDQMRISGELPAAAAAAAESSADKRRVHFNPTDSVRPIAAIGDRSEEEEEAEEEVVDCSAPVFSPVARDTETEPMDGMHSNDSFMCALAGDDRLLRAVEEEQQDEEEVAVAEDGRTVTATKARDDGEDIVDQSDDFWNVTINEADGAERFVQSHLGDDATTAELADAGEMRSPPPKRAKLRQRSVSSLNASFRSVNAMSDFEFDFDAFGGGNEEGDLNAHDMSFNDAGSAYGVGGDGDGRAGGGFGGDLSRANSDFFDFDLGSNFERSNGDLF